MQVLLHPDLSITDGIFKECMQVLLYPDLLSITDGIFRSACRCYCTLTCQSLMVFSRSACRCYCTLTFCQSLMVFSRSACRCYWPWPSVNHWRYFQGVHAGVTVPRPSVNHWWYFQGVYIHLSIFASGPGSCINSLVTTNMVFSENVYTPRCFCICVTRVLRYFCFCFWILYQFTGHNQRVIFRERIDTQVFLHLRYQGTDCALMVSVNDFPATPTSSRHGDFLAAFLNRYVGTCIHSNTSCNKLAWTTKHSAS